MKDPLPVRRCSTIGVQAFREAEVLAKLEKHLGSNSFTSRPSDRRLRGSSPEKSPLTPADLSFYPSIGLRILAAMQKGDPGTF